jgi:hypothetical protein
MHWQEFHAAYHRQIAGMATKMLRRWSAPDAVEPADLAQEITLASWRAWESWHPGRGGMPRPAFALCSGRLAAQRWLHVQRNALRRDGRSPSRHEVSERTLDATIDRETSPGQEAAIEFAEMVREALRECSTAEAAMLSRLTAEQFAVMVDTYAGRTTW